MKELGVVLQGKMDHIDQPVYLNPRGWTHSSHRKKIKLARLGKTHYRDWDNLNIEMVAIPFQPLICLYTN